MWQWDKKALELERKHKGSNSLEAFWTQDSACLALGFSLRYNLYPPVRSKCYTKTKSQKSVFTLDICVSKHSVATKLCISYTSLVSHSTTFIILLWLKFRTRLSKGVNMQTINRRIFCQLKKLLKKHCGCE